MTKYRKLVPPGTGDDAAKRARTDLDVPFKLESWADAQALGLRPPPPHPVARLHQAIRRYLAALAAVFAVACTTVFAVNALVDPLWYVGGNKFAPRNFTFDERLAKTNLLLDDGSASYNCLVLGSSRTMLMNVGRLRGYRCFNYSFSGGRIAEFVAFGKYAKHHGLSPRLVIVNVDAANFDDRDNVKLIIPDFIKALAAPPSMFRSYLSLDSFDLSVRTLLGLSPGPRYYDRRFVGQVLPDRQRYRADKGLIARMIGRNFTTRNLVHYQALRDLFPDARLIGVVSPISASVIAQRQERGTLEPGLEAIYAARGILDGLYDFSVPSTVTANRDNYYDDSHFDREIYDRIVDVFNGGQADFGLDLGTLSRADYSRAYAEGLRRFGYLPDDEAATMLGVP